MLLLNLVTKRDIKALHDWKLLNYSKWNLLLSSSAALPTLPLLSALQSKKSSDKPRETPSLNSLLQHAHAPSVELAQVLASPSSAKLCTLDQAKVHQPPRAHPSPQPPTPNTPRTVSKPYAHATLPSTVLEQLPLELELSALTELLKHKNRTFSPNQALPPHPQTDKRDTNPHPSLTTLVALPQEP
jgi:hypothetical protein